MYRAREGYSDSPKDYQPLAKFNHTKDVVNILVSQIFIWEADAPNWFVGEDSGFFITEVDSVEINHSYKELINNAVVKFPKGVLIKRHVVERDVITGEKTDVIIERKYKAATDTGEVIVPNSSIDDRDNESTTRADMLDAEVGIIDSSYRTYYVGHDSSQIDFKTGWRITVKLGYINSEDPLRDEKLKKIRDGKSVADCITRFTGFITSMSVDTPLELQCENMASVLKKKNAPDLVAKKDYTVNDFLSPKGKFKLLQDTGIDLYVPTEEVGDTINVGKVNLDSDVTVADILNEWSKSGLMCMMTEDGSAVRVGELKLDQEYNGDALNKRQVSLQWHFGEIDFLYGDWDIAENRLTARRMDKDYLAVQCTGYIGAKRDTYKFVLRLKPNEPILHPDKKNQWEFINVHQSKHLKKHKKKGGAQNTDSCGVKVDLKKYHIVPFIYHKSTTIEDLKNRAIEYFMRYNPTGIEGSVTTFGDLHIYPADIVGIIFPRQQEYDGYYMVEQVSIKFSASGGFRQELKLPRRLKGYSKRVKIIW